MARWQCITRTALRPTVFSVLTSPARCLQREMPRDVKFTRGLIEIVVAKVNTAGFDMPFEYFSSSFRNKLKIKKNIYVYSLLFFRIPRYLTTKFSLNPNPWSHRRAASTYDSNPPFVTPDAHPRLAEWIISTVRNKTIFNCHLWKILFLLSNTHDLSNSNICF